MGELRAPGLRANWLNAWLAALGVTVLIDGARLRWSDDGVPVAVLEVPSADDVATAVAEALPRSDQLDALAIARPRLERRVTPDRYRAAAAIARRSQSDFSLAASLTDLAPPEDSGVLRHGPFDPAVPRGETLWDRLRRCRETLEGAGRVEDLVRRSLEGNGIRFGINGLGFDVTRISDTDAAAKYVDPVIEYLAFWGLAFFPVRGDGKRLRTRGWGTTPSVLVWPVWRPPLDRWAIDALLGLAFGTRQVKRWRELGLGIHRAYESVRYQASGDDRTTGFASRSVL
ncbi:MAG TPA: hypothetical protein VKY90_13150 [Candidatus Dormibacteraeota bacterium]|nr:hypothetical protein [Candidatus Dormibacteraeota bacterium]